MGKFQNGRPWLTVIMDSSPTGRDPVQGNCASCGIFVYESLFMLDDAWGVWRGECPKCRAINLLGGPGRGYNSGFMMLVLPTDHEMKMNEWPETVPTRACFCKDCRAVNEEIVGQEEEVRENVQV